MVVTVGRALHRITLSLAPSTGRCSSIILRPLSVSAVQAKSDLLFRFVAGKSKLGSLKKLQGPLVDESDVSTENLDALATAGHLASDGDGLYPDEATADTLFNGIKYKDLPYVYIKLTKNNTRMAAYQSDGNQLHYTTPQLNGFFNAKKKTNVAAQAVGLAMGQKLRQLNQKTVRVRIDGFNVGRLSGLTGLTQAGLTIVSVSDVTWVDWAWTRRAKKRRRV